MLSPKNLFRAFAISLGLVFAMPFVAHAESINISDESHLIDSAGEGAEMVLMDNITMNQNLIIRADSSIDLNGHTLTLGNTTVAPFATLTILDSSENQSGTIVNTGSFTVQVGNSTKHGVLILESGTIDATDATYGAIRNYGEVIMNGGVIKTSVYGVYTQENSVFTMNGGLIDVVDAHGIGVQLSKPGSKFIMNGGKIYGLGSYINNRGELDGVAGVAAFKDTEVIINGGEIETFSSALIGNGSGAESGNDGRNVKFTVNGGTLSSAYAAAIYAPQQQGETVITGGTLKGITGIEVRAGNLTISGGEFISIHDTYDATNYTNGMATWGAAISVQQHTTKQPIEVNISGGTFTAPVPLSITNSLNYGDDITSLVTVNVEGGTFNSDSGTPVASFRSLPFITGGIYSTSVINLVADGYGEVLLEEGGTAVEVTPIHSITVEGDSSNFVIINEDEVPYKDTVEIDVVDDPDLKEVIELVNNATGEVTRIYGDSFTMPNDDVTVRVRYVNFTSHKVTFRVVNGTWANGETDDIEIEIIENDNEVVILHESDFPIEMLAGEGFAGGAWNRIVNGEEEITEDLVFVYEFEEEDIDVPATSDDESNDVNIPNTGTSESDGESAAGFDTNSIVYGAGVIALICGLSFMFAKTRREVKALKK